MHKISIFLSHPQPYNLAQKQFIDHIVSYLSNRSIAARTLGVTDYDMSEPLMACRRLLYDCCGMLTVAFRRSNIQKGVFKPNSDIGYKAEKVNDIWLTSPWCHIESAMAYQIGLPILILRERGVRDEGVLQKGVAGLSLPEFDLNDNIDDYFKSNEWKQLVNTWEGYVRQVFNHKGKPPHLYSETI